MQHTPTSKERTMITLDLTNRAARMLEGGRLTATFVSPHSGLHITVNAKCRKAPAQPGGKWTASTLAEANIIFLTVPNASGGWADKIGKWTPARGFVADAGADQARAYCAKTLLDWVQGLPVPPSLQILEEDRCGCCGRALTDPQSIERGIGPECYGRMTDSRHEVRGSMDDPAPSKAPVASLAAAATREAQYNAQGEEAFDWAPEPEPTTPAPVARDKQGVPVGVGDWKARKAYAKACRAEDTKARKADKPCSQMSTLPGETWEDMFRPAAAAKGIEL
jgi:hypothetical protein